MEPFVGEIRYVGFTYAPNGWAVCDGRLLPIMQNMALFSLLGTTFGGDGRSTFALPDFRGRIGVGQGDAPDLSPYATGETGGVERVALTEAQIPAHSHRLRGRAAVATSSAPSSGTFARPNAARNGNLYAATADASAAADTIAPAGGGEAHENRAPGLVLLPIIALQGVYPPRP